MAGYLELLQYACRNLWYITFCFVARAFWCLQFSASVGACLRRMYSAILQLDALHAPLQVNLNSLGMLVILGQS